MRREPDVPADANITYEIELLSSEDEPSLSAMPVCDRLRLRYIVLHSVHM